MRASPWVRCCGEGAGGDHGLYVRRLQVIAVEGINSSGYKMVVRRICEGAYTLVGYHHANPPMALMTKEHDLGAVLQASPAPSCRRQSARSVSTSTTSSSRYPPPVDTTTSTATRLLLGSDTARHAALLLSACSACHVQGGSALSVMVAAGPFTTSDSLEYEPLEDLLRVVVARKPDVCVLAGPFVDANHPRSAPARDTCWEESPRGSSRGAGLADSLWWVRAAASRRARRRCVRTTTTTAAPWW